MKKIVISESQLKKITKSLIAEQSTNQTSIEGRKAIINPDGTLSILNNIGKYIKIRLMTKNMGDVNVVKFVKTKKGNYQIETKLGVNKIFDLEKVKKLLNFVDSTEKISNPIDSSLLTGPLTAEKK